MYIVQFCENVLSLRLFCKNIVGCHILEKFKLCIQELEYVLYAADILPRFHQIISWKKEKFL